MKIDEAKREKILKALQEMHEEAKIHFDNQRIPTDPLVQQYAQGFIKGVIFALKVLGINVIFNSRHEPSEVRE